MRAHMFTVLTLGAAFAFGTPAIAADLPPSGTIKIHSSVKLSSQEVQVAEKHLIGSEYGWGVTFNDAGSGPLHMGSLYCGESFEAINGPYKLVGNCAFGNAGGADKIFVVYTGTAADSAEGTGIITGGIGKFAGIQGKLAWECKFVDASQGLLACTQQFDYQLKSATN